MRLDDFRVIIMRVWKDERSTATQGSGNRDVDEVVSRQKINWPKKNML